MNYYPIFLALRGRPCLSLEGGCEPERAVAVIQSGTRSSQKSLMGTAKTIGDLVDRGKLGPPAVIIVGNVVKLGRELQWFNDNVGGHGLSFVQLPEKSVELRVP